MRVLIVGVAAALCLGGCQKTEKAEAAAWPWSSGRAQGRYFGVGHYAPGRMWEQLAADEKAGDPARARPADDEQVIIVMDSVTGEVRQCGNLSGRCIGMNPWAEPLAPTRSAPVAVAQHAEDLDREAAADTRP